MSFLAAIAEPAAAPAHHSAADTLREIPTEFWWKMGLGIGGVIAAVIILRKVLKMNKVMLIVGGLLAATIIGFNWIYERNEPGWATPAVQWLAGFFPTKGKVPAKGHS